jgi:hypothetical protein
LQADFEKQADPNDPQQQALLEEMRTHLKKVRPAAVVAFFFWKPSHIHTSFVQKLVWVYRTAVGIDKARHLTEVCRPRVEGVAAVPACA